MATIYDLELKFLLREEVDLELLVSMVGESLKLSGCEVSIFLGDFYCRILRFLIGMSVIDLCRF